MTDSAAWVTVLFCLTTTPLQIDNKLSFSDNSDLIYKKSKQRLYLLRKLRSFHVSHELLQIVYKSLVESVLTFNIVVWYGNLGVKGKAKLARIVGMAGKIIGAKQDSLSDLYQLNGKLHGSRTTQITPSFLSFRNSGQADDTKCRLPGRMFYPECCFCFKFSGYLICWPCGFQGSASLTL